MNVIKLIAQSLLFGVSAGAESDGVQCEHVENKHPPKMAATVSDKICLFVDHPKSKYQFATLFRLHDVQTHTPLKIRSIPVHLYSSGTIRSLVYNNRISILQWWVDSQLELPFDRRWLVGGLRSVVLLQWCKENGFIAECWENAIDDERDPDVLQWWKDSGFELRYSAKALEYASERAGTGVLEWWRSSGLPLNLDGTARAVQTASKQQRLDVLEWWRAECGPDMPCTAEAMDAASSCGHIAVLEWWKGSSLVPKYTEAAIDKASELGRVEALQWWKKSGLPLKYSSAAIDNSYMANIIIPRVLVVGAIICAFARAMTLIKPDIFYIPKNWREMDLFDFLRNRLPAAKFRELYRPKLLEVLLEMERFARDVLRWWIDSGLEMGFDANTLQTQKLAHS
ncbi:hypothetical protein DFJ73DRAFT_796319, partial [Zopfochytrium polystomum]